MAEAFAARYPPNSRTALASLSCRPLSCWPPVFLVFEVGGDVVDGLKRAKDVAVPQKPFQPLQLGGEGGRLLGWALNT